MFRETLGLNLFEREDRQLLPDLHDRQNATVKQLLAPWHFDGRLVQVGGLSSI